MRRLCRADALPVGAALGFAAPPGGFTGLFAVGTGAGVRVYLNVCPHVGVALDRPIGRFLSADGSRIVCGTHFAEFEPQSGLCVAGPCEGRSLEPIEAAVVDGMVVVADDAGL